VEQLIRINEAELINEASHSMDFLDHTILNEGSATSGISDSIGLANPNSSAKKEMR